MICVTVSRPRHRFTIAEYQAMAERGADLVELRVDALITVVDFKRLLRDRPCPAIVTCRRPQEGGSYKRTEQERLILMRTAVFEKADYVDLEFDIAKKIPRYGSTKRIISYHNFKETPADLQAIYDEAAQLDPDIIKICTMANNQSDNVRMLQFVKQTTIPTVGFCMGEYGIPSRVLCGAYGAPFTYCCPDAESSAAPGQIPFDVMKNLYQFNEITERTPVYGVVADPVAHSMSPLIHNSAFAETEMDKVYLPFRVAVDQIGDFVNNIAPQLNVKGLSVTIPHKESVIPFLEEPSPAVKRIGACNTIVWKEGRKLGFNTDYQASMDAISGIFGWQEPLEIVTTAEHPDGICSSLPLAGKTALVLGAGGVGKALAIGLKLRGATLVLSDVDQLRADSLANKIQAQSVAWEKRGELRPDLIVNCTPAGMHPNVDATPYDPAWLQSPKPGQTLGAFDCVYNPESTLFLKNAQKAGWKIATGLDMFVGQAKIQFEKFSECPAPVEIMKNAVKKATSSQQW